MALIDPIPITLDKPRYLYFNKWAVRQTEIELTKLWGTEHTFYRAMLQLATALSEGQVGNLSVTNLSVLLWQGCLRDDPTLTLAQIDEALPVFEPGALVPYVLKLMEAWQVVSPPLQIPAEEPTAGADPLDESTGTATGPLLASISG